MSLTEREAWTVIHGMVLGAIFLLAFAGGWPACGASARNSLPPEGYVSASLVWRSARF
jgi:hypothetical protein